MENEEKYVTALDAAVAEQESVRKQIIELEKRDARLEVTIATLLRLINNEDVEPSSSGSELGLTDTVRNVLKTTDEALTPVQVRDGLIKMGVNQADYTNLLASVHNILKRLITSEEVKKIVSDEGVFYKWIKPRPRWLDTLVAAGVFDTPAKESGSGEAETPPAGLKVQPRQTRVRVSGIEPRQPKKNPTFKPSTQPADERTTRIHIDKLKEALKPKGK